MVHALDTAAIFPHLTCNKPSRACTEPDVSGIMCSTLMLVTPFYTHLIALLTESQRKSLAHAPRLS